jgi:hypothetical protein
MTAPTVELHEGFSEPDPAGRTGLVYGISPDKVLAFGKGPYTQTRYRFRSGQDLA